MEKQTQTKKGNVLLLDFASEKNRGDAAMQEAIVDLAKRHFANTQLSVLTVFGSNQFPHCLNQFDHTYPDDQIDFHGGLLDTFDILDETKLQRSILPLKLRKLLALVRGALLVGSLSVQLPMPLVMFFLNEQQRTSLDLIRRTDFIIWNGRNFRSHSRWKEPLDIFVLCLHPLICILLKKPIVCLGASVWELDNSISRWMLRFVFFRCELVTLREESSFAYVKRLLRDKADRVNLQQVPDLSLYVLRGLGSKVQRTVSDRPTIGLTVVGRREIGDEKSFESYIQQLRKVIEYITTELNGKVVVIPQVTFAPESNADALRTIFSDVPDDVYEVISESHNVSELVQAYKNIDFLVASRMHSAIFALTAGTPVLAIAYDHGAKWKILQYMGLPDKYVMSTHNLSAGDLKDTFLDAWTFREDTIREVGHVLNKDVYPTLDDHFLEVRDIFEKFRV